MVGSPKRKSPKKSGKKAKKSLVCSKSPKKWNALKKRRSPKSKLTGKRSPKKISVKGKTLWMRWLWAFHCEATKLAKDMKVAKENMPKYSASMKAAHEIYDAKIKNNKFTEAELHALAVQALGGRLPPPLPAKPKAVAPAAPARPFSMVDFQ